MLSRRHSLSHRLTLILRLLVGSLLCIGWLAAMAFFYVSERTELFETVNTAASIVAAQSAAPLMFGDEKVLQENLTALTHLRQFAGGAIVPARGQLVDQAVVLEANGPLLAEALVLLGGGNIARSGLSIVIRKPILHNDVVRGDLILWVNMLDDMLEFVKLLLASLVMVSLLYVACIYVIRREITRIVTPIIDLTSIAKDFAQHARTGSAIGAIPRMEIGYRDEVGQLADAFNVMFESIQERDDLVDQQAFELEQLVSDLRSLMTRLRSVREEERTRISHELHDELGQRLTALKFELLAKDVPISDELIGQIDELIRVVRTISWELRPSILDSLGLIAAIEWLVSDFSRRTGIPAGHDLPDHDPLLPLEMNTDIFRICQEALTNVIRHAGASRVDIIYEVSDDSIDLEIKDNGRGIQPRERDTPSLGLVGMRERAERWAGQMEISFAAPDVAPPGTCIHFNIPRPAESRAETLQELE